MDNDDFDIYSWRPKALCLGSGGIKGINMLGAIYVAWMHNMLSEVDTYIGCSVGAVLSVMYICGWTPYKLMEEACEATLFRDFTDIQWTKVVDEFGLFPNSTFDDMLAKKMRSMIVKKLKMMPTLSEFYKMTGKRLIIVTVSLKEERVIYLTPENSPDLDLLTALRMTSNAPIIFGKLEHQEDYFVDGAIITPFPIKYLDDGRTPILGIGVKDKRAWKFRDMTMMGYYDRITSLPLTELTNFAIANASDECVCVIIPVEDEMSMMDDGKDVEKRIAMFQSGYRFMEQFLENYRRPKSKRFHGHLEINGSTIKGCLKTSPVKFLLKCAKENPQLLQDCMSKEDIFALQQLFGNSPKNSEMTIDESIISRIDATLESDKVPQPPKLVKKESMVAKNVSGEENKSTEKKESATRNVAGEENKSTEKKDMDKKEEIPKKKENDTKEVPKNVREQLDKKKKQPFSEFRKDNKSSKSGQPMPFQQMREAGKSSNSSQYKKQRKHATEKMKDNPQTKNNPEKRIVEFGTSPRTRKHDRHNEMQIINVEQEEEDDDIIEIPRAETPFGPPPFYSHHQHRPPDLHDVLFQNLMGGFRMPSHGQAMVIRIDIDPKLMRDMMQNLGEMMAIGMNYVSLMRTLTNK